MKTTQTQNRTPVKREKAEEYILLLLISFAGTILLTRLFLELTGYPQIGSGELHIAHMLWGGLFLFVAILLILTLANRWAVFWSAIVGGIGFGLFIDEIGKFITQSNDYFYRPAAPIVYAIFIITTFIYMRVRRSARVTPRDELYHTLQSLTETLDDDLDEVERIIIEDRLSKVIQTGEDATQVELAESLLQFIRSDKIKIVPRRKSQITVILSKINASVERIFTQNRLRWTLILGLGFIGVVSVIDLYYLSLISFKVLTHSEIPIFLIKGETQFAQNPSWFTVRLAVQGIVGFVSFLAAWFYLFRMDSRATTMAILGLTTSLIFVNMIIFYLDQFSTSIEAIFQLLLLLGVMAYRRRFILESPIEEPMVG